MTGNGDGHSGQVYDSIMPANPAQTDLVMFWKEHHLETVADYETIWSDLMAIVDKLEEIEYGGKSGDLVTEADITLFEDFDDDEVALAFAIFKEAERCDIEFIECRGNRYTLYGEGYLFGTDEEMDIEWNEYLDNYIEECVLPEMPKYYHNYFDYEKYKSECHGDGRGHSLNHYDGNENSLNVNGINYFAYRQD